MRTNTDIYIAAKEREKRFWVALFVFLGVAVIHGVAYLFSAVSYNRLSEREPLIIAYTPSGIPAFVKSYTSKYHSQIEVETFLKTALENAFQFKYSDFLGLSSQTSVDLQKKLDNTFKAKGVFYYFDPEYYPRFLKGLVASKYVDRLLIARAVVFSTLVPPVDVRINKDDRTFIAKVRLKREEITAQGRSVKTIAYTVYARWGVRTTKNPWGFYIYKIS